MQGLKKEMDIDVRVIGVTNSSEMLLSEQGLSLTDWEKQFQRWAQTSQPHILCLLYCAERAWQTARCLAPAVFWWWYWAGGRCGSCNLALYSKLLSLCFLNSATLPFPHTSPHLPPAGRLSPPTCSALATTSPPASCPTQ